MEICPYLFRLFKGFPKFISSIAFSISCVAMETWDRDKLCGLSRGVGACCRSLSGTVELEPNSPTPLVWTVFWKSENKHIKNETNRHIGNEIWIDTVWMTIIDWSQSFMNSTNTVNRTWACRPVPSVVQYQVSPAIYNIWLKSVTIDMIQLFPANVFFY